MESVEDFLREESKKLGPRVEELSGLKCDIKGLTFRVTKNFLLPVLENLSSPRNALTAHYSSKGHYSKDSSEVVISSRWIRSGNHEAILAHELTHVAQEDFFPALKDYYRYFNFGKGGPNPYPFLMDGDADIIASHFKGYGKEARIPAFAMYLIGEKNYQEFRAKRRFQYEWGKKILEEKFGGDRTEINKLYKMDAEKLIDIFELTRRYSGPYARWLEKRCS